MGGREPELKVGEASERVASGKTCGGRPEVGGREPEVKVVAGLEPEVSGNTRFPSLRAARGFGGGVGGAGHAPCR